MTRFVFKLLVARNVVEVERRPPPSNLITWNPCTLYCNHTRWKPSKFPPACLVSRILCRYQTRKMMENEAPPHDNAELALRRGSNITLRRLVLGPAGHGLLYKLSFLGGNRKECLLLSLEPSPWLQDQRRMMLRLDLQQQEHDDHLRA